MFRKLRLLYYNNREKILIAIGIIILILVLIQIIDNAIKRDYEEESNIVNANAAFSNQTYLPSGTSPVISDSNVSEIDLKEDTDIIKQFIDYGNSNNVEGAYNLLSQDCKDEMFATIDRFYNYYFQDVFSEKRSYDLETWDSTPSHVTYRIKYLNDIMATGTVNDEFIEDYITVVEENDEKKLNIHEFIYKVNVDKNSNIDGLETTVNNKYYYYDYEEVEVTFRNNSGEQVILDSKNNTESVYIKDTNGVRYAWFGNEIANQDLILDAGESVMLRFKFNKLYNQNRKDDTINFTDISMNNEVKTLEIDI